MKSNRNITKRTTYLTS